MASLLDTALRIGGDVAQQYVGEAAGKVIRRVKVESALTPVIDIDMTARVDPDDPFEIVKSRVLSMARPRITIDTVFGRHVLEPYGPPGESRWPAIRIGVAVGVAVVGLLATYGLFCGVRGLTRV